MLFIFGFVLSSSLDQRQGVCKLSSEPRKHLITVNGLSGATKLPGAGKQVGGHFFFNFYFFLFLSSGLLFAWSLNNTLNRSPLELGTYSCRDSYWEVNSAM